MMAGSDLFEREREVAAIDAAIFGGGRLIIIEASPGAGKSRLLVEALRRASTASLVVLSATGLELERQVAFGVSARLFAPFLARLASREREDVLHTAGPARWLFAGYPLGGEGPTYRPPGRATDGEATIQGLCELTEQVVARSPATARARPAMLIAVDDAHWCDEASLRFLARLSSHLDRLGIVLLLATQAGEAAATSPLADLRSRATTQVLHLAPLSIEAVAAWVRSRFPEADEAFCTACRLWCGGSPFFLETLLDEVGSTGVPPVAESVAVVRQLVPVAAGRAVRSRLDRLPGEAVALAQAVAILGESTPVARAAALAGLPVDQAEDAADALAAAHLLQPGDPLSFTHGLIAAAVESTMATFARGRAHRRAAELLAAAGAPPATVGTHLLACHPRADPWVVDHLVTAAQAATAAGQHRHAATLLRRALREAPDQAAAPGVAVARAMSAAAAGEPGADLLLADALRLIEEPSERAEAQLNLARMLIARGDFGGAAAAADRGLAEVADDHPLAPKLFNYLLMATSRYAPRRLEALKRFQPLVEQAHRGVYPADPVLAARLATRMASAGGQTERVRALARTSLAEHPLVEEGTHGIPFAFVAAGIYWIDEYEWCKQAADAALEAARSAGSPLALMAASHWQAAAAEQLGALDEAVVCAERALAVHEEGWDALAGWTSANLVSTHLYRGDTDSARAALAVATGTDPEALDWAWVLMARGRLALLDGDATSALTDFERAGRHLADGYRIDHPGVLAWRGMWALAAVQTGIAAEGRDRAEEELALARRLALPRPLSQALRTAALVAGPASNVHLLEEAVEVLRGSSAVLAYAESLLTLGAALRRADRPTAARAPLREALQRAEAMGADALRVRAEAELHAAGGRRPRARSLMASATRPGGGLTPTQLRVARLASSGLSNPQIAQRLYLTTKTVEWHLSKIYRELGITGRQDLARLLKRSHAARSGVP